MLEIYLPDKDMNLEMLLEPIGTITCHLEDLFVIMLILGFILPGLLIVLYISFIFFDKILEKLSLIFNISLTLENEACTYKHLSEWILLAVSSLIK